MPGKAIHYNPGELWRVKRVDGPGILFHDMVTGDYMRSVGGDTYEVVSSPYDPPPKELRITGDQPRKKEGWFNQVITERGEELRKQIENMFLYGTPEPSARLLGEYTIKSTSSTTPAYEEEEMEIGGGTCHLCGEGMLYSGISRTMVKNHRNVEQQIAYMCGTTILSTWKEWDTQPHETKRKRHIHVGNECLDVS